jgi:hypothetical protein
LAYWEKIINPKEKLLKSRNYENQQEKGLLILNKFFEGFIKLFGKSKYYIYHCP